MNYSEFEATDSGSISINANLSRMFFVALPQNRHPKRSASHIDSVTQHLGRRVEGTSAVLILQMLLESFRPLKPDNTICSPLMY
jgi:hypothetical protein